MFWERETQGAFFSGESEGQTPSEYTMVSVRVKYVLYFFFLPMKAQIVSLRHHAHWLGASDKVRKCVCFEKSLLSHNLYS